MGPCLKLLEAISDGEEDGRGNGGRAETATVRAPRHQERHETEGRNQQDKTRETRCIIRGTGREVPSSWIRIRVRCKKGK